VSNETLNFPCENATGGKEHPALLSVVPGQLLLSIGLATPERFKNKYLSIKIFQGLFLPM
jgi:hypothetical protein